MSDLQKSGFSGQFETVQCCSHITEATHTSSRLVTTVTLAANAPVHGQGAGVASVHRTRRRGRHAWKCAFVQLPKFEFNQWSLNTKVKESEWAVIIRHKCVESVSEIELKEAERVIQRIDRERYRQSQWQTRLLVLLNMSLMGARSPLLIV